MVSVPVRLPRAAALNWTVTLVEAPRATVNGAAGEITENAPPAPMAATLSAAPPVLAMVNVSRLLWPAATLLKLSAGYRREGRRSCAVSVERHREAGVDGIIARYA